jgi:hypothetical protein
MGLELQIKLFVTQIPLGASQEFGVQKMALEAKLC